VAAALGTGQLIWHGAGMQLLEIQNLSKSFPGLRALDRVSMSVDAGEIVALVGQNGSGKSTLVKVLSGLYEPDPGAEIRVQRAGGQVVSGDAAHAALHFIHQDLGLVSQLSTIENLDLGLPLGRRGLLPALVGEEARRARALIAEFGGDVDVHAPVGTLAAAERTIVAIARALSGWTDPHNLLVLDEPTAALEDAEVQQLFKAVRGVAERGAGVIFISHHLDEVMDLADRVVVLRDGRIVTDVARGAYDRDRLVHLITGRELETLEARPAVRDASEVVTVEGLVGGRIRGLDLSIGTGEILGVTGLLGSGRDDLAGLLFGAIPRTAGRVLVAGKAVPPSSPSSAIARAVAFVPGDRRDKAAVMTMTARENLTLPGMQSVRGAFGRLSTRLERAEARRWAATVRLHPRDPDRPLRQFSGGNQQKVVLAKWLRTRPRVLLLDEPTQGVDVGAKAAIYELIAHAAEDGAAVLVSSSDVKELALLCHRVLVLRGGRVWTQIDRPALTEERLGRETLSAGAPTTSRFATNGARP
jgi:ABC-type sugar transport system ATPase subunit